MLSHRQANCRLKRAAYRFNHRMFFRQMCKHIANFSGTLRAVVAFEQVFAFAGVILPATAQAQDAPYLTFVGAPGIGTPGLLDMPSAAPRPDGQLGISVAVAGATRRNPLSFQISPRLEPATSEIVQSGQWAGDYAGPVAIRRAER